MSIILAIIVRLNQSMYIFNESDGSIQLEVVLSNPASVDITLHIEHRNISAFSKLLRVL